MIQFSIPRYFPVLGVEHKWHGRDLPVGLALLALESESVLLDLGELEWLWRAPAPLAQEEVGHHRVEVDHVLLGFEISEE